MKSLKLVLSTKVVFLNLLFSTLLCSDFSFAQCSALSGPSYSNSCSTDYFTAISASGTGVTSSVAYGLSSCVSTYFNYYTTLGASAPTGNTVNVVVNRCLSTYTGYVTIYIDWNNDNTYQTTELTAGPYTYVAGVTTHAFSFAVPTTGIVTGTHLHMRIMLSELTTGAPCTASYGETVDYFFQANCSSLPAITTTPASGSICSGGGGISISASGAGTGGTYVWSPSTGLSATTGSPITATPGSTTTYTVTGSTSIGCTNSTTVSVSVNPTPSAISGSTSVCVGSTISLTDATSGGTWSSSSANATVGTSGIVTGVSSGTAVISYTVGGCSATKTITVNPLPGTITGSLGVCIGATSALGDPSSGGAWTISNSNATVGSASGIVTGVTAGSATITYTLATGCYTTTNVTINSLPSSIVGSLTVCPGTSTTLTDPSGGGTWSSSNSNATIGSVSGIATGVVAGTSIISYTNSLGCSATGVLTINPLPAAISGSLNVCQGSSTTLIDATGGGIWSCSNGNVTIGTSSGLVSGISVGTSVITYTIGTGCYMTAVETVNPLPASISGLSTVCVGFTISLSDVTTGGSWSSSNSNATVGSGSGIVTGVTSGTSIITYTLSTGCYTVFPITINPVPSAIAGSSSVCLGSATSLFDFTGGGVWSSSNTNASIGSSSGIVTGLSVGTCVISYTISNGCSALFPFTVNPLPLSITGALGVCVGLTTGLSDGTGGGTWSISNSNAIIGSASGIVTGVTAGTAVVTYTLSTSCFVTANLTINPLPSSVTGASTVCVGSATTFTCSTTGGTWSSSNGNISIGSASGIVTGVTAGISVVSYTLPTGCYSTAVITVNPIPSPVSGTLHVCPGLTSTLSDITGGGIWSSSNGNCTIGSASGVVTGISTGLSIISYTLGTGCFITATMTINPLPAVISGPTHVCIGSGITLTDVTAGGTWTCSNSNVAIGSSTGIVTGVAVGTSIITYTIATGCYNTVTLTIDPLPAAIAGALSVCVGGTTTLTDASTGGTWSVSNSNAAIGSVTGLVSGVSSGLSTITYTLATGCKSTASLTINPLPAAIGGTLSVCVGLTTTLTDITSGGTWSISNSNASIGSSTGLVTGITAGTSVVTYTLITGCFSTDILTINPLPALITGPSHLCVGSSVTFTDASSGGAWSSSNAHAIINGLSGLATGLTAGVTIITYTLPTGCISASVLTVDPLPSIITGTMVVCVGDSTNLSDGTSGGSWSGSNTNAIVGSSSGVVLGNSAGTSIISYTLSTGCYVTAPVTINPLPSLISGPTAVCVGSVISLTDISPGGNWSCSNSNAAIGTGTGMVTGVNAGTSVITYTLGSGCFITSIITVNALPSPISGSTSVCVGSAITLSDPGGGLWSCSNSNITIGSSTGVVTGISAGTSIVTYTLGSGCTVYSTLTVNPLPAAITGTPAVCVGVTVILSDGTPGGSWSCSNSNATVGSVSGIVTGVTAGSATITYTVGTSCFVTQNITINALPAPIAGLPSVCVSSSITLSDITTGGTWASSNGNASVGSASGIVTGILSGTTVISYTISTGCYITRVITINPLPLPVSGSSNVCVGLTTLLTDVGSGSWISSNLSIAIIGSSSGLVSGITSGPVTITYSLPTGCTTIFNMTVNPLPSAIGGATSVCLGSTSLLANAGSGTWSSSNPVVATVGSSTGLVYGNSVGSAVITFTITTGCYITAAVNVISLPLPISGPSSVCEGSIITLADPGGGIWSCSNSNIFIGSTSGIVLGVNSGTSIVTYTLGTGCQVTRSITINVTPAPISGPTSICIGNTATLTDVTTGGSWSSSNPAVVSVVSGTGFINGLAGGVSNISYAFGTGCNATASVTVNTIPPPISGLANVCVGQNTTLTDVGGGYWSCSNTSIAIIGSSSGVVTGIAAGPVTITYTLGSGCFVVKPFTVNPLPASIGGSGNICIGSAGSLTDVTPGGVWSSSNPLTASVGSTTGLVSGLAIGSVIITYTIPTGCYITKNVTVNPLPLAIIGTLTVCPGTTTSLNDPSTGGIWSSSNLLIATVGSVSGVVSGVATGTANITYTLPTGCRTTSVVTVNPLPSIITGSSAICLGSSSLESDSSPSGTWSSSNLLIATVGSATGLVTGVSNGIVNISYTVPTGCYRTKVITINPLPSSIIGIPIVCEGSSTYYTNPVTGGTWTSSNTLIATAGSGTGLISGVAVGVAQITYTLLTGCITFTPVTISPLPAPIIGPSHVCVGSTITLTDATTGGVWSIAGSLATIGSSTGIVSGLSTGTEIISYTNIATGCSRITPVIINPISPVLGSSTVCLGLSTLLYDTTFGGSWSSSAPGIASISTSGVLTGAGLGSAIITYTLPTLCSATFPVTVNPIPPYITGVDHVCVGQNIILSDATPGGTWSSSNTSIGIINPVSGILTGVSAGVATVSYSIAGCARTFSVTVNPIPATITGTLALCQGNSSTLSSSSPGGTWSSSNTAVAIIGSGSGLLNGMAAGTSNISYSLATGCFTNTTVTINPLPGSISGPSNICVGSSGTLTNPVSGGFWSSSNSGIAAINALSGVVTGISSGSAIITYTLPTGCFITRSVTINNLPAAITGSDHVCLGSTIVLTDTIAGGVWSATGSVFISVDSFTGIVTGLATGVSPVTYTLSATGCLISTLVTVNPLPLPIAGANWICTGSSASFTDVSIGGLWSSSNYAIANVGSGSGIVSGVSGGIAIISYTLPTGCVAQKNVTINPLPLPITGPGQVCLGSSITLHDAVTGAHWYSSNPLIATVDSNSGVVTGLAVGTVTITYSFGAGCSAIAPITVYPLPLVFNVTGGGSYCDGGTGVHIGLSGSSTGVNYFLYRGTTATGSFAGSGVLMDYGLQTVAGAYTVVATNSATGCSNLMSGSVNVIVIPSVVPAVIVSATPGDTVCSGTAVTFNPISSNGGTVPAYVWSVNGITVATSTNYTFVPANGDIVAVMLTSNAICALPSSVTGSKTIVVNAYGYPVVNISSTPGGSVCKGSEITINPMPVKGGSSPHYTWMKNGAFTSSGNNYTYVPVNNDQVYCIMQSNYPCRLLNTDSSSTITIAVDTPVSPIVTITANPGTLISKGQLLTLTADVISGGSNPVYQWLKNGVPISGETNRIYSSNNFGYPVDDSVTCIVTSSGICPVSAFNWVFITVSSVSVTNVSGNNGIVIMPNPNKGEFQIKGSLVASVHGQVEIEVDNILGQVIYKERVVCANGQFNNTINLGNNIDNGVYLITIIAANDRKIFHVVVEK